LRLAGAGAVTVGDTGGAKPEIYEYLEEEGYRYGIRIPADEVLQAEIEHLLTGTVAPFLYLDTNPKLALPVRLGSSM
jgi:hypothetical protein